MCSYAGTRGKMCVDKPLENNPENEEDLKRLQDIKAELMSKYKTREGEKIRSK